MDDINKTNLPIETFEIINDLMSIFVNQCQEELNIELISQFDKIKYDQLPNLTEVKSLLGKKGIEIDSQLVNLKLEDLL